MTKLSSVNGGNPHINRKKIWLKRLRDVEYFDKSAYICTIYLTEWFGRGLRSYATILSPKSRWIKQNENILLQCPCYKSFYDLLRHIIDQVTRGAAHKFLFAEILKKKKKEILFSAVVYFGAWYVKTRSINYSVREQTFMIF